MGASREQMQANARLTQRLIERAQDGDSTAQQALWNAHRRWVAAIILAHRPRTVDVDDLMQDVAVKFITKLDTLRDPAAFRPWLRRIAINVCRGTARGLKPTLSLNGAVQGHGDDESLAPRRDAPGHDLTGEQVIDQRDAAKRLFEQAMTLPSEYREPLMLRCLRSLSYQQISQILDLPVTTIETRLARARRMLREEVGEAAPLDGAY